MYSPGRDLSSIRATIDEQEADIARLDERIAALRKLRDRETRAIIHHRAFHAPIRRLPPDILCRIFEEVSYPEKLIRVCRKWEAIALAVPSLWTSPSFWSLHGNPSPLEIKPRLERAGGLPLRLRLIMCSHMHHYDGPPGPVYDQLIPFLHTVRHLELQVGRSTGMPVSSENAHTEDPSAVPALEIFEFRSEYDMVVIGEEKEAEISAFLHNAPRLRNFFWFNNDHYRVVPPCALKIPWAQLSQLQLCRMLSHFDMLTILNQTPLLEKCAFGLVHIPSQLPADTPITTLQHLASFYIKTVLDPEPLFNCLTLPALRAISINFGSGDSDYRRDEESMPPWPQAPFHAMIVRSGCNLERLHLNLHIKDRVLIGCMRHTAPGLKCLDVHGIYQKTRFREQFFQCLIVTPAECLCPQLQEISIEDCDTYASYVHAQSQLRDHQQDSDTRCLDGRKGLETLPELLEE
ncbi:hypothetical protein HWV62_27009 [Athelia sp. TMB]|nr:hypothetical protein HWV62_27009 [Athelia sp. TMB]